MDVVNCTSSESFQVHQLSSVGHQWEISLLEHDTIFPSQSLMAGQALSCFFMLKVGTREPFASLSCGMISIFFFLFVCVGEGIWFYSSNYYHIEHG
jgi:hypothetical protein